MLKYAKDSRMVYYFRLEYESMRTLTAKITHNTLRGGWGFN